MQTTTSHDEIALLRLKAAERDRLLAAMGVPDLPAALKWVEVNDENWDWRTLELSEWLRQGGDLNLANYERRLIKHVLCHEVVGLKAAARALGLTEARLKQRIEQLGGRAPWRRVFPPVRVPEVFLDGRWKLAFGEIRGGCMKLEVHRKAVVAEALRRAGDPAGAAKLLGIRPSALRKLLPS
jgi:DNA-binding protein Fis